LGDGHLGNFIKASAFPVDRPDSDGQTILNAVISQQRAPATIRMIVEAGADPILLDASGATAVHLALRMERRDIAWMLLTLWKTKRGFGTGTGSAAFARSH
jgi:ankyrin repeat protein